MYGQISNILRDRILTGEWPPGGEVPTLLALVAEFSVARATVRQALRMLAEEKLISSQQGRRSLVTYRPKAPSDVYLLFASIGKAQAGTASTSDVFARKKVPALPSYFEGPGEEVGPYMRVRKIERQDSILYAVSDNYVAEDVYRRFPANAERNVKLARLVMNHSRRKLQAFERITVSTLTDEEASRLRAPLGMPSARVVRVFVDSHDRVVLLSDVVYRGDFFAIHRDISDLLDKAAEE